MSAGQIRDAIKKSTLCKSMSINLINIIMRCLETEHIFFCSHNAIELIAFNIFGDYFGTIVKEQNESGSEWMTGFDFDSSGNLYVAFYEAGLCKYPFPTNECPFSMQIRPRQKDKEFERNINQLIRRYDLNSDTASEDVRVVNDCLFVTAMAPICGIFQLSLDGILQRIICQNEIDAPWDIRFIPSTKHRNLLMVADGRKLRIVDTAKEGKIKSILLFESAHNKPIGDFTFLKQTNDDDWILIVNLQDGIFQFHRFGMFLMLKKVDINSQIHKFKALKNKKIVNAYGISIGPDDGIYISDFANKRIVRMKVLDFEMIFDDEEEEFDYDKVEINVFIKDIKSPNFNAWCNARDIGLNFVSLPTMKWHEYIGIYEFG